MSKYQADHQDSTNNLLKKVLNVLNLGLLGQTVTNPTVDALPPGTSTEVIIQAAGSQTGGFSAVVQLQPGIVAAAYTAGDVLGPNPIKLPTLFRDVSKTAILQSVSVLDVDGQAPPLEILLSPNASTFATVADNGAFAWGAVKTRSQGHVTVTADDYVTVASRSVASKTGLGIVLDSNFYPASRDYYLAVVLTADTTFSTATPLNLALGFLLD